MRIDVDRPTPDEDASTAVPDEAVQEAGGEAADVRADAHDHFRRDIP